MEIRVEPINLIINEDIITICPCCNNILVREIRKEKYFIGDDCSYCRYLDRPFGGCGNTSTSHYGSCTCEYIEKDYLHLSCENCKSPTCINCKKILKCCNKKCGTVICQVCINKTLFNSFWKSSNPKDKLALYGTTKLKILAKDKKIKR